MENRFKNNLLGVEAPAVGACVVTPSDTADLAEPLRAITIGTGGTLAFVSSQDGRFCVTAALPAGTYPLFASRILTTGTTASVLTGWI